MANDSQPIEVQTIKLLKSKDVAKLLNISVPKAYQLIESGEIPGIHIGRCVRVHMDDLLRYLNSKKATGSSHAA